MQYMLLIYVDPATYADMTEAQGQAEMAEYFALGPSLRERGIKMSGEGLQPITTATTVRVRDGQALVTDGPFAETKELLAGYWVWKVKDMDEAIEWARRAPNTGVDEGILELRPFVTAEDFGEALTPELEAKEDELRNRTQGS